MAVGGVHRVLTAAMVDPYYCCVPDSDIPDVAFSVETTHVDLVLSHINWRGATNVSCSLLALGGKSVLAPQIWVTMLACPRPTCPKT